MNNSLYTTTTMQYVGEIALPSATGKCDICGTMFATGATFEHTPDGKMMSIGWVCADKLLFDYPPDAKHQAMIKRNKIKGDIQRSKSLRAFVRSASPALLNALRDSHYFIRDIRRFIIRYPERGLTERQVNAVIRVHSEETQRKIDGAKRKKYVSVPKDGRYEVEGAVVSIKGYDTAYGFRTRMLVVVNEGDGQWKCHGTCPSNLVDEIYNNDAGTGAVIKFTATFCIDKDNPTFARFQRPSKASFVEVDNHATLKPAYQY